MSILIKGIKKPKSCESCPFEDFGGCMFRVKQSECPLVEVPAPHGRLVDADWIREALIHTLEALKKNPKMDRQEMHLIAAFSTLGRMLEDAPTIIEAEEE